MASLASLYTRNEVGFERNYVRRVSPEQRSERVASPGKQVAHEYNS